MNRDNTNQSFLEQSSLDDLVYKDIQFSDLTHAFHNNERAYHNNSSTHHSTDDSLEIQRENFKFPKDFSFKNEEFKNLVLHLYGKTNLDWSNLKGKKRRRIRRDYQGKCKDYLIEHHGWTPGTAKIVSKMTGLPKHGIHKNILRKGLDFVVDAIAGSLPETYAEPIAKLMNEERHILTKRSIIFDAAQIAIVGSVAYSLWTGNQDNLPLTERFYTAVGVGQDVLKWWLTTSAALRVVEVAVRTTAYNINKTHTPSPVMMFPINPNFVDGIPVTILFAQDLWKKAKASHKKITNLYSEYTLPKKEKTLEELSSESLENQRKAFKFHKDFDFQTKEFRDIVLKLYGKDNFEMHNLAQWNKRRKITNEYRDKCIDYLVEHYQWPEKAAKLVSKMISLPRVKDTSTPSKKIKYYTGAFLVSYFAGNLSNRFIEPITKLSNIDREFMTSTSIWTDLFSLGAGAVTLYGLNTIDNYSLGWMENMYSALNFGKTALEVAIYANMGVRAVQIPWRTYNHVIKHKHTSSPATVINPNLLQIPPMAYLFAYDYHQTRIENKAKKERDKTEESAKYLFKSLEENQSIPEFTLLNINKDESTYDAKTA